LDSLRACSSNAAAWVGLADFVMGLFQLDSVDGPAVDGVGLGGVVVCLLGLVLQHRRRLRLAAA